MHHPPVVARRPWRSAARRTTVILGVSLSTLVFVAAAAGGQVRALTAARQALLVNDQWNWLSSADFFETKAGAAVSVQLTAHVQRLEGSLLDLVGQTLSTKELVIPKAELVGVDYNGRPVSAISLGKAHIQEVQLPAAEAASQTPLSFSVKFFPAAELVWGLPTTAPMAPAIQPAERMLASNFSFGTDSLWRTTLSIDAMVVSSPAPGVWTMPTLVVVERSDPATLSALQKWLASGLPKDGTLTFLSTNMATTLLVERFYGLRVQSVASIAAPPNAPNAIPRVKVTMTMTGLRLGTTATALK